MLAPGHVADYYDDIAADQHALNGMEPDELIDCPRCHGSGEVHTNPSPIRDPQCVLDHECPVCHGEALVAPHHFDICVEQAHPLERMRHRTARRCSNTPGHDHDRKDQS